MTDKSHIYKYFEKVNIDNNDDTTRICKICRENGKKYPTIKAAKTFNLVQYIRSALAGKCIESAQISTLFSQNMVKKIKYNFKSSIEYIYISVL